MSKKLVLCKFGRRLREVRHTKGISQEELAFRAGLDRSYIGSVERGERNIALINIIKISKVLGVPVAVLFEGRSVNS